MREDPNQFDIQIENVISSGSVGSTIDLVQITKVFRNVDYNPEEYPGLVFRLKSPKTATLIFEEGNFVCTGAKDVDSAKRAIEIVIRELKAKGIKVVGSPEITIQNIVASANLGTNINMDAAIDTLPDFYYKPDKDMPYYAMNAPEVELILFESGKLVCTGAKDKKTVIKAVDKIFNILEGHGLLYDENIGVEPNRGYHNQNNRTPKQLAKVRIYTQDDIAGFDLGDVIIDSLDKLAMLYNRCMDDEAGALTYSIWIAGIEDSIVGKYWNNQCTSHVQNVTRTSDSKFYINEKQFRSYIGEANFHEFVSDYLYFESLMEELSGLVEMEKNPSFPGVTGDISKYVHVRYNVPLYYARRLVQEEEQTKKPVQEKATPQDSEGYSGIKVSSNTRTDPHDGFSISFELSDEFASDMNEISKSSDGDTKLWEKKTEEIERLSEIGDYEARGKIIEYLEDEHYLVRSGAAYAFFFMNTYDERAIEPLKERITDEDSHVREMAISALDEMKDNSATDLIIDKLSDEASGVIEVAIRYIARVGAKKAAEPLTKLLSHKEISTREEALKTLKLIAPDKDWDIIAQKHEKQRDKSWDNFLKTSKSSMPRTEYEIIQKFKRGEITKERYNELMESLIRHLPRKN